MVRTRHGSKGAIASGPPATLPAASPAPTSKVPSQIRFPLLVLLSMGLSSFLYAVASPLTTGDLSVISRTHDEWWEIAVLLGWKAGQLAVGWYGGYDSTDVAALVFLSHVPHQWFLMSFYKIRPSTAIGCVAIDTIAAWLPFYILKVSSSIHSLKTPRGVAANRSVINDYPVQIATSLLAAGVYGVVVLGSYGTWLPVYLVIHFEGIKDISALYDGNFPYLVSFFIPLGFAAKIFLFTPATAAKPDRLDKEIAKFDPETATLAETILYNIWGFSKRTRALIIRTATLATVAGLHTSIQTFGAVEGAELFGAVGWSSVWVLATALTGAAYWWVGDVEGMDN